MSVQLSFGDAEPAGARMFHLDVQDGLGWREIADADQPGDLLKAAGRHRKAHPDDRIVIRSRNPDHDSFVTGWHPREEIIGIQDWFKAS